MSLPAPPALHRALEATWPPEATQPAPSFVLRAGAGGGKRVSAATLEQTDADAGQISAAETAMQAMGQPPLFMIRDRAHWPGDGALDAALQDRGYQIVDPTLFLAAPIDAIARAPRPMTTFPVWPPLALQAQLWSDAGIGPARQAVMARAAGPKCAFMARHQNRAAGVGFAALDRQTGIAMLHALEIVPAFRRSGVARELTGAIAHWAQGQGATHFALAVTEANLAARGLYAGLGMAEAGRYHYRCMAAATERDIP